MITQDIIVKTYLIWVVLSCLSLTAQAWTAENCPPVFFTRQQHGSALKATIDRSQIVSRRNLVKKLGVTTAFTAMILTAQAEEDPLDSFGKELSSSKWPDAPSPLPTSVKSAAELTTPDPTKNSQEKNNKQPSDLEQALQNSSKTRQVGPLTHG